MKTIKILFLLAISQFGIATVWADESTQAFPEKGKTYVLHRFNNENSYMYESGNYLFASPRTNTQKQYWEFIPTGNPNCYYIRNITSKRYVQSSHITAETQISVGSTPVEFEIKKNTVSGAAPKGYYYICSTDQTIDSSKDGTLGLNYQQSTGKIVAYHIRYNRGNSYWDIAESNYDYEAPAPIEHSEYSKKLGVYVLPCGSEGDAYLSSLNVKSVKDDAVSEMNYTATSQPSSYYCMVRNDSVSVVKNETFSLSYETSGMNSDYTVTVYFDWDRDGVFETKHEFMNAQAGTAEITVPQNAVTGRSRMRMRITENGMDGAEEDVAGMVYDFFVYTSEKQIDTSIDQISAESANINDVNMGRAYATDGRLTDPKKHKGVYIQARQKRIK